MSGCEKCWRDSGGDMLAYLKLLTERESHPCTPEQQRGDDQKPADHSDTYDTGD